MKVLFTRFTKSDPGSDIFGEKGRAFAAFERHKERRPVYF
jgi:hypothetical protein